jgi:hypothetical protein
MQIEIKSSEHERVVRHWEGKERVSFEQWAMLTQGGFVLSFLVSHQSETDVLPPGQYVLDPASFSSKNGRLFVERVRLKAIAGAASMRAAPQPVKG